MIVNLRESLNTRDRKSVNGNSKYYDLVNLYESCNLSTDNKKTLAKMINNNASDKAIYSFLYECYEGKEDIKEDTVKKDGKWVNKGKEGTHGEFKTKKAADAQRKAMFANGYKGESLKDSIAVRMPRDDFAKMCRESGILKGLSSHDYEEIRDLFYIGYKDFDAAVNDLWHSDGGYHSRDWYENLLKKYTNSVNESLKESLESEDGWSEEILDIVDPFFIEVEKVAYELRNTVRGAYRFGTTVKDLAQVFRGFSETTDDIANELDNNQEHLEEDWCSIKEESHEECVGNNCTDENDLFPEEKYFTIVVTRSDDGEDEIIDDVTKEIADKYIDDLKRDNDEFFSHAKVLDHNGKVVNSWEYLEEDYEMDRFSAFLDDDRKQRLKMQARKDKERAESIFSIHGNVFRKNDIDTDEVVVARNLSWQEAKDKLDRMQYNSNAIDMYADVWIYNDTLNREEEHWDTKGYFKDEENNYYESCSKDFEEAVKSKKSFSVKDKLKKLIPDLDI